MRIGFYQFAPVFGDKPTNLQRIRLAIESAGADLVVLPELCTTGYLFLEPEEVAALAEPIPGPSTACLAEVAARTGTHIVCGLAEREPESGGCFNSAVLVGPQGLVAAYRKAHLFDQEKRHFGRGDTPFRHHLVGSARVGMLICFDHFFPEAARTLALGGTQVVCHPSNLVLPAYGQLVSRVRAIENRVFWVLANRVGREERGGTVLAYTGESQIVSPRGEILAAAAAADEAVRVVAIDPRAADDKRVTARNDLFADRRPELYASPP